MQVQEKRDDVSRELERLQKELDRLFREMGGARPLLLGRDSKAAM